jgi:8-oxo-dGTP pyrophosphatase MutT (NUDIX family)
MTPPTFKWPSAFQSYQPFKVYGCICITENNKILLVKGRNSQKWSFPKGHRERWDRTPLDCALRELREETGLRLQDSAIGTKKYKAAEYFIFSLPQEYRLLPEDTKEVEEVGWFCFDDIHSLNKNVDVSLFCNYVSKNILHDDSISIEA